MPNLEWEAPHSLITPEGQLDFNVVAAPIGSDPTTGRIYQIQPEGYQIVPSLRVTADNLSQADGSVLHPRWKTGLVMTFTVHYLIRVGGASGVSYKPACGRDLREMHEELVAHLNAIRDHGVSSARMMWSPADLADDRMLTDIQLLAWPEPVMDGLDWGVTLALETPFPYAIDSTEAQTAIAAGATVTLVNLGTAAMKPVVRVTGPATAFTIQNLTTGLNVVYDTARPGAPDVAAGYAEFDFFRGTVYQDGNGADLISGVVPTTSDFWSLERGANDIKMIGAAALVLWNGAWA